LHHEPKHQADDQDPPEEGWRIEALETVAKIHAEQGSQCGDRQEHSDEKIQSMACLKNGRAVASLLLCLTGHHVFQPVLRIRVEQLQRAFDLPCTVPGVQDISIAGDCFPGFLESSLEVPRGTE